jgi:adenylyl-sulfate kinase
MAQGFTVWLTGLPASGKTEIAARVEESLLERGLDAERIDEGEVREQFFPGLGFERAEWEGLMRFLGHVCNLLTRNGAIAIASTVSPYQETRNELRSQIGRFVEVYVRCSTQTCEKRDTTGNYEKARKGQVKGFTGLDAPFDEPVQPEIVLDAENEDVETSAKTILRTLEILDFIPKGAGSDYDEEEEEKITKRLKDLGYI